MYKSEDANHPWRRVRDNAAYNRTYKTIGRDIKIGQLWVLLAILIVMGTTVLGGILATSLPQLSMNAGLANGGLGNGGLGNGGLGNGGLDKLVFNLHPSEKQIILSCCFAILQCLFLFIGSKYMYKLMALQMGTVALIGLLGVGYLFSMPDTRVLSFALVIVLSPYFLCAGIFTLSWRAKLYLAYMHGDF